jgi:hypothetical protein
MLSDEWKNREATILAEDAAIADLEQVSLENKAARERRSATILGIQEARAVPRRVRSRDLVPAYIREKYTELWAREDIEYVKRIAWEHSLPGRFRLWLKKAVGI